MRHSNLGAFCYPGSRILRFMRYGLSVAILVSAAVACGQEDADSPVLASPTIAGYAVDSVNGDDLGGVNTCAVRLKRDMSRIATGTPCKTIARLLAAAPPNGSNIFLARGSYWREDLDLTGRTNLTVTAYGPAVASPVDDLGRALPADSGDRPMFDGASVVDNATFSKTAGRTNVYQASETLAAGMFHGIYENGTRMTRVADVAAVDSTAGSFYAPIGSAGGAEVVYFHPVDNDDPAANGKVYELRKRKGIITCAGCSIISLAARRQSNPNGSITSYHYARDCVALDGNKHNFWFNGLCENCVAKYNEKPATYGGATLFVTFPSTLYPNPSHTQGGICRGCVAEGEDDGSTMGYYAHTSGGSVAFDRLIYDRCQANHVAAGFGIGGLVDYAIYHECTTTNTVTGATPAPTTAIVWLGGCMRMRGGGVVGGGISNNPGANPAIIVRDLKWFSNGGNDNVFRVNGTSTADISRVTAVKYGGNTANMWNNLNGNAATINSTRNIIFGGYRLYDFGTSATVASSDYNLFYGGATLDTTPNQYNYFRMPNGTTYTSFATYQAGYPALDVNSQTGNPLFSGDPSSCDMSVAGNSPAVALGAGAAVTCAADPDCAALWATYGVTPTGWIGP